jgi:hypothetical protein
MEAKHQLIQAVASSFRLHPPANCDARDNEFNKSKNAFLL